MPVNDLDRLVRKEVSLGAIREIQPPDNHIGLSQIAPFLDVETDDVIFEFIRGGLQEGLAPARAEDAEAELAQKDDLLYGEGRASLIDWSIKDKYSASDVTRYREYAFLRELANGNVSTGAPPLVFAGRTAEDFERRLARDDRLRRRKLDNRLEWLIMRGLEDAAISYNDGKIKFTVNYGRPANHHNQAPASGILWDDTTCDPIGDLLAANETVYETTGVRCTAGIMSERVLNNFWKSERFLAAAGMPLLGGTPNITLDPNYLGLNGLNRSTALRIVEQATGISFTVYDGTYRTRALGSNVFVNNRFTSSNKVILLPTMQGRQAAQGEGDNLTAAPDSLGDIDDTLIGFAKTLTSPHPAGNWGTGWYEWEDEQIDPWVHSRGTGIKAFPVFPYMEYTYTMNVLAA